MMKPVTHNEAFLAAAAGEFDGTLPEPQTRQEHYLKKILERLNEIETKYNALCQKAAESDNKD